MLDTISNLSTWQVLGISFICCIVTLWFLDWVLCINNRIIKKAMATWFGVCVAHLGFALIQEILKG